MSGGIVGVATPDPGTNALINRLANPPNPFEQLGTTVNALTNLRQFQANQAGADAYRQAVDPTTGQLDIGLYNRLMAAGPGAYNLGAAMQQAGQGVEAQGRGTSANVQSKLDQLAVQQAYMGPALGKAQQGTLTADDLIKSLNAVPAGIIDPATQASIRAQIASGENPNTIVLGGYFASQQGREMLKAQMPAYGTINSGSVIYPTQANPVAPGGTQYPTQGVPVTMTPGEVTQTNLNLMQPKESWRMPDGSMHSGSVGQWMTDFGLNPSQVYYDPNRGTVSAPGAPTITVSPPAAPAPGRVPEPTGRIPQPPAAPAAPAAPAPGGPTTQGGGKPTIPPAVAAAGEDAYNAALADMPASRQRIVTAQLALQHLQGATTGGTGTEALQAINNFLGTWPTEYLAKVIPGYDPQKAASDYQEATKYMQQITNASIPGGQGTNEKLAAAAQATPNPHMQNRAATDVLQTGVAGEQMKQYVVGQFRTSGQPPAQYQQYADEWARTHDPRAFMFQNMTPDQRAYLQKSMPKGSADRKTFNDTLHELVTNGAVPNPMQPAGQD